MFAEGLWDAISRFVRPQKAANEAPCQRSTQQEMSAREKSGFSFKGSAGAQVTPPTTHPRPSVESGLKKTKKYRIF